MAAPTPGIAQARSRSLSETEQIGGTINEEKSLVKNTVVEEAEVDPLSEELIRDEDHVHYKTLNWWHCGILTIAECISLGILSLPLPAALVTLGLIP